MLNDEVNQAVKRGKFHIWAVDTIEDGLRVLTGVEPGKRLKSGKFPKNSIYYKVEQQLQDYAKRASDFRKNLQGKKKKDSDKSRHENNGNGDADL